MSADPGMRADSRPIIVGGCHRSGTSLVRRILDAHPRIHCGPEVKFFRDFYGDFPNDPLAHIRFASTARALLPEATLLDVLGGAFIAVHERTAALAGKARWADKNPENVLYLEQWRQLLGDQWVLIHVVRNPLDTLASIKEVGFPMTVPAELNARIQFYRRYTEAGLEFRRLHPDRYRCVIYEELVTQPGTVLPALMTWLAEPFHPMQLSFNDLPHESGIEDPKVAETKAIHTDSINRWKELLTRAEAEQIMRSCGTLWRQIDPSGRYEPDVASVRLPSTTNGDVE